MLRYPPSASRRPGSFTGGVLNRTKELGLRLRDRSLQWFWFLQGVPVDRIGFGCGPLTWLRSAAHRRETREYNICLVEPDGWMGALTAWAINQSSRQCRAVRNGDLGSADVIWMYCQDPLPPAVKDLLEQRIRQHARPDAVIVNPPSAYNSYHEPDAFRRLAEAGVQVPRHVFTEEDRGRLQVVYKANGRHGAAKCLDTYDGPRPGMTAFEYVDCRQADGMSRRYRAHYLLGVVRPSEAFVSADWNVCADTAADIEYSFEMSEEEVEQVHRIAKVLGLQYFAVDFVRRASDGKAMFTDVNVYPTIQSPRVRIRKRGDFGGWHTFDARRRMGIPEPGRRDVWEVFDAAVAMLVRQKQESRALAMRAPSPEFISQLASLHPAEAPREAIHSLLPNLSLGLERTNPVEPGPARDKVRSSPEVAEAASSSAASGSSASFGTLHGRPPEEGRKGSRGGRTSKLVDGDDVAAGSHSTIQGYRNGGMQSATH
jgi:hypothetical protein